MKATAQEALIEAHSHEVTISTIHQLKRVTVTDAIMKTKPSKQPKRHKSPVALEDLKARKDAKGGTDRAGKTYYVGTANGSVWK